MGGFLHQKTFLSEVKSIWTTNKCSLISTMIMLLIDKAGLIMCGTSLTLRQQSTHSSLMVREHFLNSGQNLISLDLKATEKAAKEGRHNLKAGWWSCRSMVMLVLVMMMMMEVVSVMIVMKVSIRH